MSPNHIAKMIFVIGYACYGLPSGAQGQVTLLAHSTGVGQWVAYYAEPIKEEDLKPFMGRYLLAGKWRQDDTGSRLLGLGGESGGRGSGFKACYAHDDGSKTVGGSCRN